jgi:ABC-type branched-subunit amino acid transport system ATPase component
MATMTAIHVHALRKSYGSVHALRGIDLSIPATGQIVGLLGPNGAGKTTLVEILEGLRIASSGTVCTTRISSPHTMQRITRTPMPKVRMMIERRSCLGVKRHCETWLTVRGCRV